MQRDQCHKRHWAACITANSLVYLTSPILIKQSHQDVTTVDAQKQLYTVQYTSRTLDMYDKCTTFVRAQWQKCGWWHALSKKDLYVGQNSQGIVRYHLDSNRFPLKRCFFSHCAHTDTKDKWLNRAAICHQLVSVPNRVSCIFLLKIHS